MASRILAAALAASSFTRAAAINDPPLAKGFGPSHDAARSRGPQIFNAINNAMRQWGSSLHHNGMSFYLATVPEGVIFHHGNANESSPEDPEWLAYEIEHAESFARRRRGPPRRGPPSGGPPPPNDRHGPPTDDDQTPPHEKHGTQGRFDSIRMREKSNSQHAMVDEPSAELLKDADSMEGQGGWLHTYRTTRPLRYLYVDGMSGGKTTMGTLDSQDYLLRSDKTTVVHTMDKPPHTGKMAGRPMDERRRASELCDMCYYWDLSGIIRMEAGFEIIHCDFQDGLEQIQALQRPDPSDGDRRPGEGDPTGNLEYIRALSERYQGIGSSRTTIEFSSMVSAFFYPINLTNPDPERPDLPRLSSATDAALAAIKADLNRVISERPDEYNRTVDWQDVTDLVVARYADSLKYMVDKAGSADQVLTEINHLLTIYIDYSGKDVDQIPSAIDRCTNFYLHGISPQTEADHLIHTAIKSVTSEICTKLFEAREKLTGKNTDRAGHEPETLSDAMHIVRSLVEYLGWAHFKRCGQCGVDEVCVVPIWPFGTKEDYYSPRCANSSGIRGDGENYWGGFGRPGGHGRRPGGGRDRTGPPPR